jgi:hypothetical protein
MAPHPTGSLAGYTFDDYLASAPHASERWAATDRGWMYDEGGDCVGFYLTYEAIVGYREASVLACIYARVHPGTGYGGTCNNRSKDCGTVHEARAWMREAQTGQRALV